MSGDAAASASRPVLEVLDPGLLTTVQDAGRIGLGRLGVPEGGAADRRSLAIANLLAGNPADEPALECTLVGPTFRVLEPVTVALAGADFGALVEGSRGRLAPGFAVSLQEGSTIALPGPAAGGARAYLALAGGLAIPAVLGSASTLVGAGFGGIEGRPLRTGDLVRAVRPWPSQERGPGSWPRAGPTPRAGPGSPTVLRVTPGPHATGPDDPRIAALVAAAWTASPRSDRMGIRLDGPTLPGVWTGELATIGVLPGAVQVPPDGLPIALLVDAQPTGGYQVLVVVISADLPALAQVGPGETIRFGLVTPAMARAALRAELEELSVIAEHLREAAGWDELWRSAGS